MARVKQFGPVTNAVASVALITVCSLVFTKWFALGAVLSIWAAWRAVQLARREPEGYGGFRVAVATLVITVTAGFVLAGYGVSRIGPYFENRQLRQEAYNRANAHHLFGLLEAYKERTGSYPANLQALRRVSDETMPMDYWGEGFKYLSYTEAIAARNEAGSNSRLAGINFNNFELRSAGPDQVVGTDDDLVMRDGLFIATAEARKQPVAQDYSDR